MNGFPSCGALTGGAPLWSQNNLVTPKHSSISVTIDSQSSICGKSGPGHMSSLFVCTNLFMHACIYVCTYASIIA